MFQNGQRVCFKNGGDPARIQKVQLAYGKDRSRAPQVIPTTDPNATQVQVVTGEDAARYPFIDPIGLIGAPAAWFRADTGVTVTGLGASTWADQSGNGRDLLQGTDANRPPYLSYSGTKYLYLPGVAGNYASAPDSVPLSITGAIDLLVRCALSDYTPSAAAALLAKDTGTNRSYRLLVNTDGTLQFVYTNDGTTTTGRVATSSAANGITDGASAWIRCTYNTADGKVNFYKASDSSEVPSSWTAIGTEQTITSGTIYDGNAVAEVGSSAAGTANNATGKFYRAIIKNGIDGTTVVDFNPDLDASDASTSFASSATGETWTVNKSGGLPAQIVGRPSLLFDGSADYLKCNAFTLNQPVTVYIAFKQVSWTNTDRVFDGNAAGSGVMQQSATTPRIRIAAGANTTENAGLAVGAYGAVAAVFNGASALTQVNLSASVGGDCGAFNMGGFTLGAAADGTLPGNIQVLEAIIFPTAHDATQRARIISYLAGRHGIAL